MYKVVYTENVINTSLVEPLEIEIYIITSKLRSTDVIKIWPINFELLIITEIF